MLESISLQRHLGFFEIFMAALGYIIGAGIFSLIGKSVKYSGHFTWISFLLAGLISLFSGFSYAELSSVFSKDSAEYDYIDSAFNSKKMASFITILIILFGVISTSTISLSIGEHLSKIFPFHKIILSIIMIIIFTLINIKGIRESSNYNIVTTLIEVSGLIIIIISGLKYWNMKDILTDFKKINTQSLFHSSFIAIFAYAGFETVVKLAEETKNPTKNLPKAIISSIVVSTVLYSLITMSSVSILGPKKIAESETPLADVANQTLGKFGYNIIFVIALFSISNTILMSMVTTSRLLYGYSKKNNLFTFFNRINPKTKTPINSILIISVLSILFTFFGKLEFTAVMTNCLFFIVLALVNLSLLVIRYKYPHKIKVNYSGKYPIFPILGLFTSILMLYYMVRYKYYNIT